MIKIALLCAGVLAVAGATAGAQILKTALADAPVCDGPAISLSLHVFNTYDSGASAIYTVQNTGSSACSLSGVPALAFVDPSGAQVVPVSESPESAAVTSISLSPGSEGSFSADISDCASVESDAGQAVSDDAAQEWTFAGQDHGVRLSTATSPMASDCGVMNATVSPIEAGVMTTPAGFTPYSGPAYPLRTKSDLQSELKNLHA